MFAINHAATAVLIKRRYPDVALVPILASVQAMELLWVALNYAGIERTTTEPVVRYVGDIHLLHAQILVTLAAVWWAVRRDQRTFGPPPAAAGQHASVPSSARDAA